jgi:hypothetical protein
MGSSESMMCIHILVSASLSWLDLELFRDGIDRLSGLALAVGSFPGSIQVKPSDTLCPLPTIDLTF